MSTIPKDNSGTKMLSVSPSCLVATNSRQNLENIFAEARQAGAVRAAVDCHFAAQAVIGLCNAWGDIIVRDDRMDVMETAQKCTDLLLNGFRQPAVKANH